MKMVDFSSWFDADEARLAIFSSFEFEPMHFESRLMRSKALSGARRIIVFVDADQFQKLLTERPPARWINQRYLVVPVKRKSGGVFHPKLGLLLGEHHARLFCGSNNLTQAGSAHNLELLNSVVVTTGGDAPKLEHLHMVTAALDFFKACLEFSEPQAAKVAKRWLDDASGEFPWLAEAPASDRTDDKIELVHTLGGSIWDWLRKRLGKSVPRKIQVLSPFYDGDLRLLGRVRETWPACAVEITAQQRTSNLPAKQLGQFGKNVCLFDLEGAGSRRLHAKLVMVTTDDKTICLSGSANFTAAAFDGKNVETCLAWTAGNGIAKELFSGDFTRVSISPAEFEPGVEQPPEEDTQPASPLFIKSALLDASGKLMVAYKVKDGIKIEKLGVAIQRLGESSPAVCLEVKGNSAGMAEFALKAELISSFGGAVVVFLTAESSGLTSPPTWLIQEHRLTHEASEGGEHQGRETEIRETGRGLVEQLVEIGTKEGQLQVIQYLANLSIRFDDEERKKHGRVGFRPHIRDPYRPDNAPLWMTDSVGQFPNIEAAILEFADRHEHKVLQRHCNRANINGLENFLDVLKTVTKLLYAYWRWGVVGKNQMIGRLTVYVDILTGGSEGDRQKDGDVFDDEKQGPFGYIAALSEMFQGNFNLLKKPFEENNVAGHLRALLLIAQTVRANPNESGCSRPSLCLQTKLGQVRKSLGTVKMWPPTSDKVAKALRDYEMLTEDEIAAWLKELTS
jgi:hypothetical protein